MDNKTNKHEFACNAGKVTEYEVKEHIDTIMVGFRGFSKDDEADLLSLQKSN